MSRLANIIPRPALLAIAAVCLANIVIFFAVGDFLGGTAGNGKIEGDRYFVGDHGKYFEVSKAVYAYSYWHGVSIFATNLLGGLAGLAWYRTRPRG